MPIFISYSHKDATFVNHLAKQLMYNGVHIWVDRWELNVGDSLLSRVQEAISGASALLVILSKASVQSAWCQKEINGGLVRELEERRVVVLPVLLEDCEIPIFLREKLYADFRIDFDAGLRTILETVARFNTDNMGRLDDQKYHTDWGIDWGWQGDNFRISLVLVEQSVEQPYCVLSITEILADEIASRRYANLSDERDEQSERTRIIEIVTNNINTPKELTYLLHDQREKSNMFIIPDQKSGEYAVLVKARRLGMDIGRDVYLRVGNQLKNIVQHMKNIDYQP